MFPSRTACEITASCGPEPARPVCTSRDADFITRRPYITANFDQSYEGQFSQVLLMTGDHFNRLHFRTRDELSPDRDPPSAGEP
jgi:hypothetical protein